MGYWFDFYSVDQHFSTLAALDFKSQNSSVNLATPPAAWGFLGSFPHLKFAKIETHQVGSLLLGVEKKERVITLGRRKSLNGKMDWWPKLMFKNGPAKNLLNAFENKNIVLGAFFFFMILHHVQSTIKSSHLPQLKAFWSQHLFAVCWAPPLFHSHRADLSSRPRHWLWNSLCLGPKSHPFTNMSCK